jgi:1-acyl-sn-glycerol-3-phosphate acyltransferase
MNTTASISAHPVELIVAPCRVARGTVRIFGLLLIAVLAVIDAGIVRLVTEPTGSHLAHARAAWLHRWSCLVCCALGLRVKKQGFIPASGIVAANHIGLFDAIVLAAVRPCVFVAGNEIRHRPFLGWLARLSGALFFDRSRLHDITRINFMIRRAVQRRLLVVVFPERGFFDGPVLRAFTSALFQPAVELGCTLTAAAIGYQANASADDTPPLFAESPSLFHQIARLAAQCRSGATIAFGAPIYRRGDRKRLARQLRREVFVLQMQPTHKQPLALLPKPFRAT